MSKGWTTYITCAISSSTSWRQSSVICSAEFISLGFAQALTECLTELHRETCEILAQCETIPDISFDLARNRPRIRGRLTWLGLHRLQDRLSSQYWSGSPGLLGRRQSSFRGGNCRVSRQPTAVTAVVLRSNTAWTQQRTKKKRYRVAATEAGMLLHGLVIEVSVFTVNGAMIFHIIRSFNHYIFLGTANTFIPQAILANY